MMSRRSTSRRRSTEMQATSESRQPQQEDGRSSNRRSSSSQQQSNNNVPRSPQRSTPGNQQQQSTPPPPSKSMSTHPKTRCYRLNLEKPFDIRTCKSPLGRDYSGPPIHESDLPPAAGPVEYIPPIHLCSKEEINARRHSWGGVYARSFQQSMSNMGADLMMNLHVSNSDDSSDNDNSNSNSTSIAITTARIFRGIEVDRNGVITSMNDRAKRSAAKNGGGSTKTKVGEKSRQAAKIDKAKDLIDDVDNGGGGGMSDEENDPTKVVSLFVMGEYEDLNDLVRDGSKKLRDSKSISDETLFSYNRPSPYRSQGSSQGGGPLSPIQQDVTMSSAASPVPPPPSTSQGPSSPIANIRKRVFSADKSRSRSYKQVPRSAPPKLKSNPRDSSTAGTTSGSSSRRTSRSSPRSSSQQQQPASSPQATYDRQQSIHVHAGGPFGCVPLTAHGATTSSVDPSKGGSSGQHYDFQQNCNFFPGNSNWTEALGNFNLWNCGANVPLSRTMSPHSNPSSPRNGDPNGGQPQVQDFHHSPRVTGGGVYHGSGAPVSPHQHTSYHSSSGYHHQQQVHHHQQHQGSTSVNSGYTGYGAPQFRDEGRNPSYNHRSSGVGARDTVVM